MRVKKSVTAVLSCFAAVLLALALWAGLFSSPVLITAHAEGDYRYNITAFDVTMSVSADRSVEVSEKITAYFTGRDSHGIIRDLPLDKGVRYKNVSATCDNSDFQYYSQDDNSSFLSVYMRGNAVITGQTRTYTVKYTMIVPALSEEGYLPLDVIGYGWQTDIQNVTATVTLPEAPLDYKVYSGYYGTTSNEYAEVTQEGNTFSLTAASLPRRGDNAAGITLDLSFREGALSVAFDWSLLWAIGIAFALIAAAVLVKVLFCHRPVFVAPVNLTAPDEMDPLRMGKLIDNSVDSEDIGAIVFWFADQGYLTIDLTNEKDPLLIKTDKPLPADAPAYQKMMYDGLFRRKTQTYISDLKDKFYTTADKVRASVPTVSGGIYQGKTVGMTVIFGVLTALICALFSFVYSKTVIRDYFYWLPAVTSLIAFVLSAMGAATSVQYEYKWGKGKRIGIAVGCTLVGCAVGFAAYMFPNAAFDFWTTVILTVGGAVTGLIAGGSLCRTQAYTEKLGQIVGFKNFILYTEKDKIKFMLEENPDLYYHILPYAQVLGVTDEWSDKFKGLSMSAPSYARYTAGDAFFDYLYWTSMFRIMNSTMSHNMTSRPSSSGGGFNSGGGFGGGFGGGGFGGGGGRGC